MKVRLEDQRIVFRLNDEARTNLVHDKKIRTEVDFGNGALAFQLELSSAVSSLKMNFDKNEINVLMPENYIHLWDKIKVGFEEDVKLDNGKEVNLIIEKDLKRSKKRGV